MAVSERSVPRSVAPVLEALELEQPVLVTLERLENLVVETGVEVSGSVAARLLRERGWLLPLRATGVWEFAPGARAGAIGGGDPFIELRARLETRPLEASVAAESAAWLQGLASGGAGEAADELITLAPDGKGPFHLGPRERPSKYERRFDVADHVFPSAWSVKGAR